MATQPRVFNIPASAPFLRTLLTALMEDRLGLGFKPERDPLALAAVTIYLPTRRACRLARECFLEIVGGDAAILPRLVSLNDVDADEILFAEAGNDLTASALDLGEPLGGLERNALLAQLILKWAAHIAPGEKDRAPLIANSPAAALSLAQDLARLMDDIATRKVNWDRLDDLVPDDLDRYWQATLDFLKFIHEPWRAILDEKGRIEPAERRDKLIAAEAARLANHPGPVIAAGSTGSIPATAMLLSTIAGLPHGALVLPGLDTDLDAAAWAMIAGQNFKDQDFKGRKFKDRDNKDQSDAAHGHPQFAMHALLQRIGTVRDAVITLGRPEPHGRELICSEALRPAAASEIWQRRLAEPAFAAHADAALKTIAVIEAANAEEEALSIAVALHEAMEKPGKTAALVTPDRALARRVLAALARWNVAVDDSGGDALPDTPAGVFARLAAEAALERLAPVTLLALLKHEHCKFDRHAVATLERAVLRGPRPKPGSAGLAHALATFRGELAKFRRREESSLHRSDPRTAISDAELDAAAALIEQIKQALAPLEELPPKPMPFKDINRRHRETIARLGGLTDELIKGFDAIDATDGLEVTPADYAELFEAATADIPVRRPEQDVRVRIFGPLEARLQSVDLMILGGLVEGVWPPETRADPWLNRSMRHRLGLDLPERRIGLSAHDFAQSLGAPEVILTRAAKLGGAPTVASRFVQRLAAVAGEQRWNDALKNGANYVSLARALDAPAGKPEAAARPSPRPPVEARPRQLSVTEIEHWLRDPYTIYAKHILKLAPLDEIDTPPGTADRGTIIHNAIGEFARTYARQLPAEPARALIEIGEKHFEAYADYPEARAFWWPRFLRIAAWFAGFERERRATLQFIDAEIGGGIAIPFGNEEFKLTVRADRIEHRSDGRYAVLDYKTGTPPTDKQVRTGLSPQLTLEAAILRQGGFKGIAAGGSVAELVYVRLRGGAEAGEISSVKFDDSTPDEHADHALARLTELVRKFADPQVAYFSLVHPMWTTHYGTYDHLARVKEWSQSGVAGDDGGGE